MADLGRILIFSGVALLILGLLLVVGSRIPWFGQLPGDITVQRGNFSLFAPIGTMIVVSIILTIVVNLVARFWR
jgi:hypothetical protein